MQPCCGITAKICQDSPNKWVLTCRILKKCSWLHLLCENCVRVKKNTSNNTFLMKWTLIYNIFVCTVISCINIVCCASIQNISSSLNVKIGHDTCINKQPMILLFYRIGSKDVEITYCFWIFPFNQREGFSDAATMWSQTKV